MILGILKELKDLLKELISEIKGLRADLKKKNLETCTPEEALMIIGLNNKRYLPYYVNQQILNRRKGGKSYLYFKSECNTLAEMLKSKSIIPPPVRDLHLYKD